MATKQDTSISRAAKVIEAKKKYLTAAMDYRRKMEIAKTKKEQQGKKPNKD